ncbi:related to sister chromatid cohesion protein Ctf8 [Ramularia collo-cygni]|uniref:Related to sister chromatid cohesion protein Ctf8 n=1 Tax=Ramularia collo-cygni TaxID=112498 RepID=A0A2D3V8T6_9PEZI|nr:related to sister chromatid cohesion protein Ctf8 [Ramularia collo-cygni]CZT24423.1 related to sister chromatid cohesion protein Ctf8 [Ramularia collo-cygni]
MPSISLNRPTQQPTLSIQNPLPQILHTPSGLALIELQGSVLSEQTSHQVSTAINLGRLVFPADDSSQTSEWDGKRVFLFVGKHQRMAGEVKKLGKAIAVVRKSRREGAGEGEVEVEEIVRFKMIFAHRPEPMGAEQKLVGEGE